MHPKNISIVDYTYHLPEENIAKYPLSERDASKLLIYKDGVIETSLYKKLDQHLPKKSLIVFNNTKVVEARLLFEKSSGSNIEIFCLEPDDRYGDITSAMLQKEKVYWKCLVGGAKKWKEPFLQKKIDATTHLFARIEEKRNDYFLIEFNWSNSNLSFAEVLHDAGLIPLPPYLNRTVEEEDKTTYQTIYAMHNGSVAAPTAGLHFTENLMRKLKHQNVEPIYVTLHVGAGTFKPVKAATMQEHEMHAEFIDVSKESIEQLISNKTIVATGTTSLRTIESLYWMGIKIEVRRQKGEGGREKEEVRRQKGEGEREEGEDRKEKGEDRRQKGEGGREKVEDRREKGEDRRQKGEGEREKREDRKEKMEDRSEDLDELSIKQWDAYELPQNISKATALQALLNWMNEQNLDRLICKTQIIIAPGYTLKVADGLITNFHQPQSTLLLLIAAIVGDKWKDIYNYAMKNNFRFLSYGDGSLLWK
ncbi:MAG TPA: S-adenosylmethionine:tRNA ribosyltransferase-isomerase [Chitinophagaceae bacterium]|jgi:S-adenosylmethionine:tRNA ribosyltransferase-isomerase|nr:S-adenosylmethionine:tRNA ribosyltransferase-isomerase [Chitinophagaceae bacterium]